MKLYYHKTDGGAEYLCSENTEGTDEGDLTSKYIVRIDGNITKEAELMIADHEINVIAFIKDGLLFEAVTDTPNITLTTVDLDTNGSDADCTVEGDLAFINDEVVTVDPDRVHDIIMEATK